MFPLTCKSTSDRRIRATRGDRFRSSDARERLAREDRAIDIAENPERGTVKKAIGEGTAAVCIEMLTRSWVTVRAEPHVSGCVSLSRNRTGALSPNSRNGALRQFVSKACSATPE